ncbi:class II aldolase/adducin family protein [Pseudonocardia xishanensis]|uniref:Class II aldolase/adducin family protein n=1 Tax=Pseudonocardia xishanensis TaxID=630995 RepID=A0ABP8S3U5_9PSEU
MNDPGSASRAQRSPRAETSSLAAAKQAVVDLGRRLAADGLVVGTAGNVSVRTGELVAVSPSGMPYRDITTEDVAVLGLDGTDLGGGRPSSEAPLHLAVYASTDAAAVVHHHGLHSAAVSTVCDVLPAVHYYVMKLGGPPRVAPYATYGTPELAASVEAALAGRTAALMQSHGAVAYGASPDEAYDRAELVEWLCAMWAAAVRLGDPRVLDDAELAAVVRRMGES